MTTTIDTAHESRASEDPELAQLGVDSEVGQLRQVILHRPGLELIRLTPQNREALLFDDVLWPSKARSEHDGFADALTDEWSPTQALADLVTMRETSARPLDEISVCFLGDGRNNVARSVLTSAALLGMDVRIAAPSQLQPSRDLVAQAIAVGSGARFR
jgi:arginine deiminase